MSAVIRGVLVAALVVIVGVAPVVYYREVYAYSKRLRVVDPGRLYRSGQLTAAGFADAVASLHIRTVINAQDEFEDPDIYEGFWATRTVKETELCRRLGVRYVHLKPGTVSRRRTPQERPAAIDEFLAVMDDPANYPVLLHCHAGLHRTGILSAVYRMEYQGWSPAAAFRELKAQGFGEWVCTRANDYVAQYVLTYQPGRRHATGRSGNLPHDSTADASAQP
jgi:protein tyrosine/serine phosphatase